MAGCSGGEENESFEHFARSMWSTCVFLDVADACVYGRGSVRKIIFQMKRNIYNCCLCYVLLLYVVVLCEVVGMERANEK